MRIIQPSVSLITEKDPFKKIELAGRTCYKSEDKITDTSAKKFVGMLISRGHLAMCEHAIFCFTKVFDNYLEAVNTVDMIDFKDSNVTITEIRDKKYRVIFSANMRVLIEQQLIEFDNNWNIVYLAPIAKLGMVLCDFEDDIADKTDYEIYNHRYTTMRFITDRGVTHELVRHRKCSFAQESTRYVNYTKSEMLFIEPTNYKNWNPQLQGMFLSACSVAEEDYCFMMNHGAVAQQARAVLPNAIKTEIVITTYDEEWRHIYELRCDKTAHPDCRRVANASKSIYLSTYGENALHDFNEEEV